MTKEDNVTPFPFSKMLGRNRNHPVKELGKTPLLLALSGKSSQALGHWCSSCEGVWYGLRTEVECPVCGNRGG